MAHIWNPPPHIEFESRDRKTTQKLRGRPAWSTLCETEQERSCFSKVEENLTPENCLPSSTWAVLARAWSDTQAHT